MNAVQNSVPSLSIDDGGGIVVETVAVETEGVEIVDKELVLIPVETDVDVSVWAEKRKQKIMKKKKCVISVIGKSESY